MAIAVGDIHGCLDALQGLLRQVPPAEELVFLGDYIDRGPDSAGVVRFLRRLADQRPCRFLRGNHEALMLAAIADRSLAPSWFSNGGQATLASYGVDPHRWPLSDDRGRFVARDREFFESLSAYWEDDTTIFVHAGIDVRIPEMARQSEDALLWIRERFYLNADRWQGKQIVFGHTPTLSMGLTGTAIFQRGNCHGIDTGCVYGGYLTALDTQTHALYQEPGP
jgi:serine/threonine protein phosphatase 1